MYKKKSLSVWDESIINKFNESQAKGPLPQELEVIAESDGEDDLTSYLPTESQSVFGALNLGNASGLPGMVKDKKE